MASIIIPAKRIARSIHWVRGQKVLLDFDLALLYEVTTSALNQAVRRNRDRFPDDFVFQLSAQEEAFLISQNVISRPGRGGRRHRLFAFTEQGVAMLSSVLKSGRAVKVNVAIMRAFVRLRETLDNNRELARKFEELEVRVGRHDEEIAAIIEANPATDRAGEKVAARDWVPRPRSRAALRISEEPMSQPSLSADRIAGAIYFFRGQRVMLDFDLAALYRVATKVLNQAVKRNTARFPADFMFQLNAEEVERLGSQIVTLKVESAPGKARLRSQIVTLKQGEHRKYRPYAFTEQGVAMLSSVLRSERAVQVNVAIMRAFVELRAALESNRELARKFSKLEERVGKHDGEIAAIIEAIRQLIAPEKKSRREIGFHLRETAPRYGTRRR